MNYFFQIGHISGELFVDEICNWHEDDIEQLTRLIDLTKLFQNEVLPKYMRAELEESNITDELGFYEFKTKIKSISIYEGYFRILVSWEFLTEEYAETFDLRFQPIQETNCLNKYMFDMD